MVSKNARFDYGFGNVYTCQTGFRALFYTFSRSQSEVRLTRSDALYAGEFHQLPSHIGSEVGCVCCEFLCSYLTIDWVFSLHLALRTDLSNEKVSTLDDV